MQVPRDGLVAKLTKLTVSQQSIESVASFCIFYSRDAKGVVQTWETEFYKAPGDRRLALLYLANHILQEGRKKGPAFQDEFFKVLPKTLGAMCKASDDKTRKAVTRMVSIWEERRVFGSRHIKSIKDAVAAPSGGAARASSASAKAKLPQLGPAVDALAEAQRAAEAAAATSSQYAAEWRQDMLESSSLQELGTATGLLKGLMTALQAEMAARRQAVAALQQEAAAQGAAIAAAEARLPQLLQQQAEVERRISAVTSSMSSMQGGGGAGGGNSAAHNGAAAGGGSPQAPAMEEDDDAAALEGLMQEAFESHPLQQQPLQQALQPLQPLQPQQQLTPAFQPPPGVMLQPMQPHALQPPPQGSIAPGAPLLFPGPGAPPQGGPMAPLSGVGGDLHQLLSSGMLAQAIQQVHGGGGGGFGAQQAVMPGGGGGSGPAPAPGPYMSAAAAHPQGVFGFMAGADEDQPYDPEQPD